ncbi:MAG: periplasmic heavy metal sensor [Pedosphaera sp.]|nr:periplasmic heavy metal sensor [Pedosphaera sp.]
MKTNPSSRLLLTMTIAALLAGSLSAPAQPKPDNNPDNRPPAGRQFQRGDRPQGDRPQGGFQQGGQRGQMFPMMERVLTDDQKESLRTAMEGQREKMRPIEEKVRDARREMMQAGFAAKLDEEALRAKALEVGKLEADLTVLRARAFSQMKPALSAEQIEQLKNPPPSNPDGGEGRPANARRPNQNAPGPRDQNDLPPKPK